MAKYRRSLPQLSEQLFLTDGGIETTLIYLEMQELPLFAAFHLFSSTSGESILRKYFETYASLASELRSGMILESPTWRASSEWGKKLGYTDQQLLEIHKRAIDLLVETRSRFETPSTPIVISGCIGPRGDGYVADRAMNAEVAQRYHSFQVDTFASLQADLVTAMTMNYIEEAIGITLAARVAEMPVVISFTVETDGRLPTGQPLGDAIQELDSLSDSYPAYYMINCAHPTHFRSTIDPSCPWVQRIRGLRANASTMSHAELDRATSLDAGDPQDLAEHYASLKQSCLPNPNAA